MILRAFLAQLALTFIIVGVFSAALFYNVPSVDAGEVCHGVTLLTSYYGKESGNRTADGSFFDGTQLYAASRGLKFGTRLRLTYKGRSVIVVVRDRGPAAWTGRALDISKAAAERLGMIPAGVVRLCAERL